MNEDLKLLPFEKQNMNQLHQDLYDKIKEYNQLNVAEILGILELLKMNYYRNL